MKFIIEITRGNSPRERIRREPQEHSCEADAIEAAKRLLHALRAANPKNPPEGYRVLDRDDRLVDCGWGSAMGA